jgi:hypothetical protein
MGLPDLQADLNFHVAAWLNYSAGLAFFVIGLYVIPGLRMSRVARAAAAIFFVACAVHHVVHGIHLTGIYAHHPIWWGEWIVYGLLATMPWVFIVLTRPWRRVRVLIVPYSEEHDGFAVAGQAEEAEVIDHAFIAKREEK